MHPRFLFSFILCAAFSFVADAAPVLALKFSPDDESLCIGRYGKVSVEPLGTNVSKRELETDFPTITSMSFHPTGSLFAVAGGESGRDGRFHIFAWPSGEPLLTKRDFTDLASSIAFSPDGESLAVAGEYEARVYRILENGKKLELRFLLEGHADRIQTMAYSPDGHEIVSGGLDRSLKVWNAATGELKRSLNNHTDVIHCVAYSPLIDTSGTAICATGSDDQTVRVWQPDIGRMVRIIRNQESPVYSLAYNSTGNRLFTAGKEGVIRVISGDSDQIVTEWKAHHDWIYSLAINSGDSLLASGDWNGQVKIWSLNDHVEKNETPRLLNTIAE